jgi:hypothetical protein
MDFANGTTLLAALPIYAGHDYPREWVVAVDRGAEYGAHHRYATALVESLDATTWHAGYYCNTQREVMTDLYDRSGILDSAHLVREGKSVGTRALAPSS